MPFDPLQLLTQHPVVAILRGIRPNEILDVSEVLVAEGIRVIEVPLNSPDPYTSIRLLCERFGNTCLCGAGTVVTVEQVEQVHQAGGKLIVAPNTDPDIIRRSLELGMIPVPGFNTPTEAYQAIHAGATYLKVFPATSIGPDYFKSISAILPTNVGVVATGGINPENICDWLKMGVTAVGIGGDLYQPGVALEELQQKAQALVTATIRAQ
ncbi:2-dehydro-3-deoxy-6-phosphogalactonate aldolase [Porticoccus sp. W117]|uniref:2-dehydro-3-deoxy-6-phosphogalactonate aldolase n=1 Tax=Porticoccus sp. W117 TaxID=3054777 RepID=UPI0025973C04|nr:2-dehydro-3-deoxy-6-phosphogalactonate aldolase [Porticoccus sp. W117]MDM3870057.1 2-dehydro-3-deoxy-6-phosphogalactonate aldolase [Porticoccus sp. W117]